MSLTVVGSIAFDSVRTPFGERDRMLGGSAVHFALAASFFTDVGVVGPVGDDFGEAELDVLRQRGVETRDIERVEGGETFFWRGHYEHDLNVAHTDDTQLNVFGDFDPKLSDVSSSADIVFLGNIQPELQRGVRAQCNGAGLVALDSMNLWIETARDSLVRRDRRGRLPDAQRRRAADADRGAEPGPRRPRRDGAGPADRRRQARRVRRRAVHGRRLLRDPGLPLEDVRDPTGAGDSFAGGFLGYLDGAGAHDGDDRELRRAMAYGSVLASFNVEDFGTERVSA